MPRTTPPLNSPPTVINGSATCWTTTSTPLLSPRAASPARPGPRPPRLVSLHRHPRCPTGCPHAPRTGQDARIVPLSAGIVSLLRNDGPWTAAITCHATAAQAAQRLGDRLGEAGALNNLGAVRRGTGA